MTRLDGGSNLELRSSNRTLSYLIILFKKFFNKNLDFDRENYQIF